MDPNAFMLTDDEHTYATEAYAALVKEPPSLDPEDTGDGIAQTRGVVVHQDKPVSYSAAETIALDRLEKMQPGDCEAIAYRLKPVGAPGQELAVPTTGWLVYGVPDPTIDPSKPQAAATPPDAPPAVAPAAPRRRPQASATDPEAARRALNATVRQISPRGWHI